MTNIEIPFGAHDSELKGWEYTIPEGFTAEIKDGKVIVKEKESENEKIRKSLVDYFGRYNPKDKWDEEFSFKDVLAYLEKQKEQKSIENVVKDITKNKEAAIKFLKSTGIMDDNGELAEMYRSEEQKPAEWSEEDERNFYWISATIQERHLTPEYAQQVHKILSWLKSLRPHWKPSEWQMRMLLAVINEPNNAGAESCHIAFMSLYNDLKKLI